MTPRSPSAKNSTISGTVRLGRDPRVLARTLAKGNVAIIDRVDIDAASAEALANKAPACVINASPSLTGRFTARGAERLIARGIPLYDAADRTVLGIADGSQAVVAIAEEGDNATIDVDGTDIHLRAVTAEDVEEQLAKAPAGSALRVPEVTAGALDLIHRDGPALIEGGAVRGLDLDLAGKDVLVVAAGAGFERQLRTLRTAVKEMRMAVVTTGEAADAVAAVHRIGLIVGPFDGVSDDVLKKAERVVVHGESHTAAATRLGALGVRYVSSDSRLESADLAVAIAASAGARTIATVGLETTLPELIESPRGASALLARVAAGTAWIDGGMLARLYRPRWSRAQSWILIVIAVAALAGALTLHPEVRDLIDSWFGGS